MHTIVRTRLAALLLAAAPLLAACSTDRAGVTAPAASLNVVEDVVGAVDSVASALAGTELLAATALTRKSALAQDQWGAAYVTPAAGGVLEIKQAGLSVSVPPGAVAKPMIIWGVARAGSLVAYEFGPHGTQFLAPLKVKQDLKPTSWYKLVDRSTVEVGYFKDRTQLDRTTGVAVIDEFLPIDAVTQQNKIEFRIHHFSGYLLSTGRTTRK